MDSFHSHNMTSFQSCINDDQERSKIFVERINADWSPCQKSEQLPHPFFSDHGKIQIGSIDFGDCLFNKGWPDLDRPLIFSAVSKEPLLSSSNGLDRHEVIDDDIPPSTILT